MTGAVVQPDYEEQQLPLSPKDKKLVASIGTGALAVNALAYVGAAKGNPVAIAYVIFQGLITVGAAIWVAWGISTESKL